MIDLWIARRRRPFVIVEDPEFIELLTMLYDKVAIPSTSTVSRDLQEIFEHSQTKVAALLKVCLLHRKYVSLTRLSVIPRKTSLVHRRLDVSQHHLVYWDYCALDNRRPNAESFA
jgi:hypothetical protein